MGEITRQLMSNNFEPVFSFQRDPVQNRMLMGDRIRELREQKNTDITTLAFYRISEGVSKVASGTPRRGKSS